MVASVAWPLATVAAKRKLDTSRDKIYPLRFAGPRVISSTATMAEALVNLWVAVIVTFGGVNEHLRARPKSFCFPVRRPRALNRRRAAPIGSKDAVAHSAPGGREF